MPITCTGRPSADASSSFVGGDERAREVARHVEHRRAPGAEQRVGHLAHDRSRSGCASTASSIGSNARGRRRVCTLVSHRVELQQVVAELGDARRPARIDDDRRRRLDDDRRAGDRRARRRAARRRGPAISTGAPSSWKQAGAARAARRRPGARSREPRLAQWARGAALPVDALDVLAGLAHREDALVRGVEVLDHAARRRPSSSNGRAASGTSSSQTWYG